jgi:DNA-directed RNA polymerase specialized sigma24 family protein
MNRQQASSRPSLKRSAAADQKLALVRAILQLPTDLRDGFLLHRMAGVSYEEISQNSASSARWFRPIWRKLSRG